MKENLKQIFNNIFKINYWKSKESISGPGSEKIQTITLRKELPELFLKLKIKTILDAPCGDFNWMNILNISKYIDIYYGYDIVDNLIENNKIKYSNKKIKFFCNNLINCKLPKVDLIICRDCLVHLQLVDALKIIQNFKKSQSKYLLLTNYSNITINKDTKDGHWRPLNFILEPFNFPKPIYTINENYIDDGSYSGKEMSLWYINNFF